MTDLFSRGGDITNMDELKEAVRRDPVGAAIVIHDLQEELDLSVGLRESVERVGEEVRARLTVAEGLLRESGKLHILDYLTTGEGVEG